jgi:hypothetical protein
MIFPISMSVPRTRISVSLAPLGERVGVRGYRGSGVHHTIFGPANNP